MMAQKRVAIEAHGHAAENHVPCANGEGGRGGRSAAVVGDAPSSNGDDSIPGQEPPSAMEATYLDHVRMKRSLLVQSKKIQQLTSKVETLEAEKGAMQHEVDTLRMAVFETSTSLDQTAEKYKRDAVEAAVREIAHDRQTFAEGRKEAIVRIGELEDALEVALKACLGVHRQLLKLGLSCEDLAKSNLHLSVAAQDAPAEDQPALALAGKAIEAIVGVMRSMEGSGVFDLLDPVVDETQQQKSPPGAPTAAVGSTGADSAEAGGINPPWGPAGSIPPVPSHSPTPKDVVMPVKAGDNLGGQEGTEDGRSRIGKILEDDRRKEEQSADNGTGEGRAGGAIKIGRKGMDHDSTSAKSGNDVNDVDAAATTVGSADVVVRDGCQGDDHALEHDATGGYEDRGEEKGSSGVVQAGLSDGRELEGRRGGIGEEEVSLLGRGDEASRITAGNETAPRIVI